MGKNGMAILGGAILAAIVLYALFFIFFGVKIVV